MKLVISGASGLLGRAVLTEAKARDYEVRGLAFSRASPDLDKLDLNDAKAVEKYLGDEKPECFIHCAAERRPDVAEGNPEATRQLNVQVPKMLAHLAEQLNFYLIYISTDYVFDGNAPPDGYEPDATPNPTNLYGETKLQGEEEIFKTKCNSTILRVPVLYGKAQSNEESAINILMNGALQTSKQTKMDDWATRYPTNVGDVARVLCDIADAHHKGKSIPKRLHFSSQGLYTKYSIACLFAKISGVDSTQHLIRQPDGPKPSETQRPRDCHLSVSALQEIGIDVSTVDFEDWWRRYIKASVAL